MKRFDPLLFTIAFAGIALAALNPLYTIGSASIARLAQADKKAQAPRPASSQDKSRDLLHTEKSTDAAAVTPNENTFGAQAFGLVIGISKYKNLPAKAQLQFADEDARAIRDLLVSPKGGFKPENVTLLVNEQATYQEITRALEQLQNRSGLRDLAFIFFAGHGFVNQSKQGFLLAYDSQPGDLLLTAMEMDRFNSVLKNIRARSTVILSDACHSGAIGDLVTQSASAQVSNITAKAFDPSGRIDQSSFILSAASPSQSSWEMPSLRHGLFTYHVLEGLNGKADRNNDGLVNAKELYDYTATQVQADAEKAGHSQVPEFNPQYDYTIPLSYLNEPGLKLFQEWFESDPVVTRYAAFFDEALEGGFLIKPEGQSAWNYFNILASSTRTPPEKIKQMREQLQTKLVSGGEKIIAESPSDSAQWEEASTWLERAFDLSRDVSLRARQYYCSAMARHYSNENGRAERECDNALEIIKDNNLKEPLLCLRIGQFYKTLAKWEKARNSYKLAIETDPNVEWIAQYAEVLIELKDYEEAESQLRRARELDPNYATGLRALAQVLLLMDERDKFGEAIEIASQARKIKPDDIDIEEVYGWALLKAGDSARALEPLRKVARVRLSDERKRDDALLRLSQAYWQSGDLGRSISALREAEQRNSQRVEIYHDLSRRLEEQGDLVGAISAAEKAVSLVQNDPQKKAGTLRSVAEYLERAGRLTQAAEKYKEAALLSVDAKVNTALDGHARALAFRAGRLQDAGAAPKRAASSRILLSNMGGLLIVPGGREALERLTGVRIEESHEALALAAVFDACLRDAATGSRLVYFYSKYTEFARRMQSKGVAGRFELPAADKPASAPAVEALKFFGIRDKAGRREIEKKEFDAKKVILEALGGDAEKLARGEATFINIKNNEFSVPLGMTRWISWIRDAMGARPDDLMLAFLKDQQAMRLYAGLSMMPEETVDYAVANFYSKENLKDFPASIYFAAPYLRFDQEGRLYIPGQRQGELNWQKALKTDSPFTAMKMLFKKDSGEALYLFAALSASGKAGDLIASSPLFNKFYALLKNSDALPKRNSFDLIDLLSFLSVDNGQLRLPKAVELWLKGERGDIDTVDALLSKIEKHIPGQPLLVAKQIAALELVERERQDWLTNYKSAELIAGQVAAGRESLVETALDLQLDSKQLEIYLAQTARLDAISTPAQKQARTRIFQAAFELLRLMARRQAIAQDRLKEITDRLLDLDTGSDSYAFEMAGYLVKDLLGLEQSASGRQAEDRLVRMLGTCALYWLPKLKENTHAGNGSNGNLTSATFYEFDGSKQGREQVARRLQSLKHTRFHSVINALNALDNLEKSPSDASAIEQLKTALEEFVEPEMPPPPKKGKPKQPVVAVPTLKQMAVAISAPISPGAISDMRYQIAPFLAESLIGAVCAAALYTLPDKDGGYSDLVLKHNLDINAWGDAVFDEAAKSIRGNIARFGYAIGDIESRTLNRRDETVESKQSPALQAFTATTLNSYSLVDHRYVTARALEYVARSLDLGEDVFGRYLLGDQAARDIVAQLEQILLPRRARAVRALLGQSEAKRAIEALSLSELYFLGQRYFELRLATDKLSSFTDEPGAMGAMARIAEKSQAIESDRTSSDGLAKEIRQFGLTIFTRAGLMRLDLRALEPYEQTTGFDDARRLVERVQDFKLGAARACYQKGYPASLSLSLFLAQSVLRQAISEMGKNTGRTPPDRDWQALVSAVQAWDETTLAAFLNKLNESSYARALTESKWDEEIGRAK